MTTPTQNVYRVLPAPGWPNESPEEAEVRRNIFKERIAALAEKSGETIHFHTYKNPSGVAHNLTLILLECSDEFIKEVKKLPTFGTAILSDKSHHKLFPTERKALSTLRGLREEFAAQSSPVATERVQALNAAIQSLGKDLKQGPK